MDNQIHHFDDLDSEIYFIENEHNIFSQEDDCNTLELETEQYQRGYQNAMNDFQRMLNLRSRDIVVNKGMIHVNNPSSSK